MKVVDDVDAIDAIDSQCAKGADNDVHVTLPLLLDVYMPPLTM